MLYNGKKRSKAKATPMLRRGEKKYVEHGVPLWNKGKAEPMLRRA